MANEIENQGMAPEIETTEKDYINVIQEMKNSTVSKDKYNELLNENRNLINTLASGGTLSGAEVPTIRSSQEIKKELWGSNKRHSETEFVELALELREAVLAETGEDCFIPTGHYVTPTAEAYASAQRFADVARECLDYAGGNDEVFSNELSRRLIDTPMANTINTKRR